MLEEPSAVVTRRARPAEVRQAHTRILRLALGVEESRAYWEHVDPSVPRLARPDLAFQQRWFGGKSLHRVRFLLANLADRYDPYPDALGALRTWRAMDVATREVICHCHLQLTDPLYRKFTGDFLVRRRAERSARVDRDVVLRWVQSEYPERWSASTVVQFASKLLSAASEARLVSRRRDPRDLLYPKVPDVALTYILYLLRGVRFEGTLLENPYLASLGLSGGLVEQRLRSLAGLTYRRMGSLTEIDWAAPSLSAWAEATR